MRLELPQDTVKPLLTQPITVPADTAVRPVRSPQDTLTTTPSNPDTSDTSPSAQTGDSLPVIRNIADSVAVLQDTAEVEFVAEPTRPTRPVNRDTTAIEVIQLDSTATGLFLANNTAGSQFDLEIPTVDFSSITSYRNPYGATSSGGEITFRPSMFSGHFLREGSGRPVERDTGGGWVFLGLLAVLLLMTIVKLVHLKRIKHYLTAVFAERIYLQLVREESGILSPATIMLGLSSLMLWGTFIYQAGEYYAFWGEQQVSLILLKIIAGMLLFFILKMVLYVSAGILLNVLPQTSGYLFTQAMTFGLSGILMFPVVMTLQYLDIIPGQILVISGFVIAGIMFLYRSHRGFLMAMDSGGLSKFYLFLYFCALELVPLLLVYKEVSERL